MSDVVQNTAFRNYLDWWPRVTSNANGEQKPPGVHPNNNHLATSLVELQESA